MKNFLINDIFMDLYLIKKLNITYNWLSRTLAVFPWWLEESYAVNLLTYLLTLSTSVQSNIWYLTFDIRYYQISVSFAIAYLAYFGLPYSTVPANHHCSRRSRVCPSRRLQYRTWWQDWCDGESGCLLILERVLQRDLCAVLRSILRLLSAGSLRHYMCVTYALHMRYICVTYMLNMSNTVKHMQHQCNIVSNKEFQTATKI